MSVRVSFYLDFYNVESDLLSKNLRHHKLYNRCGPDHISISVACSSYCLASCKPKIIHLRNLRKTNITFHFL